MTQTVYVPVKDELVTGLQSRLRVMTPDTNLLDFVNKTQAILLTPEEAEKIKFVLDILTQPVFQKDYPEYSKLATESLKIFSK